MTVIYTADIGGHDDVQPFAAQERGSRFVRFGDDDRDPRGWEARLPRHPKGLPDRLAGRWYKCHPHVLFPGELTIWVDACIEVTSPTFADEAFDGVASYGAFRHPDRSDVWAEAEAAATLAKYDGARHGPLLRAWASTLTAPNELWAMTVLARHPTRAVRRLDHLTWSETLRWSGPGDVVALDQLILPFLDDGILVDPLRPPDGGNLWDNGWFVRRPHRRAS